MMEILVFYSISEAATWVKYFENMGGWEFFYDKDSITYTNQGTVQVWEKAGPNVDIDSKAWLEYRELREVDCTRRRYKTLSGRVLYNDKPMEILQESSWIYLEPDGPDEAFYKTICERK